MHSTAVRLLRSVVPLGLLVSLTASSQSQTFMAVGTVSWTHPIDPKATEVHRPFTAFVDGAKWLIRVTVSEQDAPYAYFEAAFNGTERFLHWDLKQQVPGAITSHLDIHLDSAPRAEISYTAPIWLALASTEYFQKRTNSVITPLWLNPPRHLVPSYAATGRWKLSEQLPMMLREAAFYETAGWLTGPYKDGFLRQRYFVTAWTNLGGLTLPLEGVLQDHSPKRLMKDGKPVLEGGKSVFIGKDRDDTEPFFGSIWTVTVKAYQLGAKPARYEPSPPAKTMVHDRRFAWPTPNRPMLNYHLADQEAATNRAVRVSPR